MRPGAGKERVAAMMGLAEPGGVTRATPRPRPALSPSNRSPEWASATTAPRYSRFVHQLSHLPHVQHRAPRGTGRRLPLLLPTDPGTLPCRGSSRPGSLPPAASNSPSQHLPWPQQRRRR
ncbi:hypothetical protein P7K49_003895 [Saguinus oedipus]|uniref:Uncharacterized protein n=1 Tax=Saguinus oedipus TaxID=9490 RepID=A0ABQ9W7G9_SAGOE|nr:hypothetical protein P7K49_003895 [Saguinus oedipus]